MSDSDSGSPDRIAAQPTGLRAAGSPSAVSSRQRVTDWLLRSVEETGVRVLAVGPAVAAHLDLARLGPDVVDLHLADFGDDLLRRSLDAQQMPLDPTRHHALHDPAQLDASVARLKAISAERSPGFHDVQEAIDAAAAAPGWELPGPFDVVLSAEGLGMLGSICQAAVGSEHPSLGEWLRAVRVRHLRQMIDLLRPDGLGIVINVLVSSRLMPSLAKVPDEAFEGILTEVLERQRVPPHADPRVPLHSLEFDAALRDRVAAARLIRPWRSAHGEQHYAFSGLSFRTRDVVVDEQEEGAD